MNKFNEALELIYSNDTWENENDFLIDILFTSSFRIFIKCYEEFEKENNLFIIPILLRQVQENIIVLLGLLSGGYDFKEFVKKDYKINPDKIMKKVKESDKNINIDDFERIDKFLIKIKVSV